MRSFGAPALRVIASNAINRALYMTGRHCARGALRLSAGAVREFVLALASSGPSHRAASAHDAPTGVVARNG